MFCENHEERLLAFLGFYDTMGTTWESRTIREGGTENEGSSGEDP